MRSVFRMEDRPEPLTGKFLGGPADIVVEVLIAEVDESVRRRRPRHSRDGVDRQVQAKFAFRKVSLCGRFPAKVLWLRAVAQFAHLPAGQTGLRCRELELREFEPIREGRTACAS